MSTVLATLLLVLSASSPWKEGDQIAGWKVERVFVHPEYQRFVMRQGARRTQLEVTFTREPGSPWESRHYRVQPAPGHEAELPLIRAMLSHLKALETQDRHKPSITQVSVDTTRPHRVAHLMLISFPWALLLAVPWIGLLWLMRRPLCRGYAAWIRLTAPWFSSGTPLGPQSEKPWIETALLAIAAGLVGSGFLLLSSAPPPCPCPAHPPAPRPRGYPVAPAELDPLGSGAGGLGHRIAGHRLRPDLRPDPHEAAERSPPTHHHHRRRCRQTDSHPPRGQPLGDSPRGRGPAPRGTPGQRGARDRRPPAEGHPPPAPGQLGSPPAPARFPGDARHAAMRVHRVYRADVTNSETPRTETTRRRRHA